MTQIIGFAGRKQAGKDTACNFILAVKLAELGVCKSSRLTKKGTIEVTDILDEKVNGKEWFPLRAPFVDVESLFEERVSHHIKIYSFAEKLKDLAVNVLGIERRLVYGTDKDKNKKTDLKWENMPTSTKLKGSMTVREVLQYVGTDLFRKMLNNIWVENCIKQIQTDAPELALVSDVRFTNEVKAIQKENGMVVGLTRTVDGVDSHKSETEAEKCLHLCDETIDNKDLSISQQNEQIYYKIKHLEVIPEII